MGSSSYPSLSHAAYSDIETLSLHDALPILARPRSNFSSVTTFRSSPRFFSLHSGEKPPKYGSRRSEEHRSELQSQSNLVCRLLLEKKNDVMPWYLGRCITFRCSYRAEGDAV